MRQVRQTRSGRRVPRPSSVTAALALVLIPTACRRSSAVRAEEPLRVAVASDAVLAFEALARRFEPTHPVLVTAGSSGQLAAQIVQGAPFGLFASADAHFVDETVAAGACDSESRAVYAHGSLSLVVRAGDPLPEEGLVGLASGRFRRVAVANPEHAPYGRAAREALEHVNIWQKLAGRIVYAESVRQVLAFVESGDAEAGVVATSLLRGPVEGRALPIPSTWHRGLTQTLVLCGGRRPRSVERAFRAFVLSEEGRAILAEHGLSQ